MNLVLMGPPGAGKGTQGEILSKRLDINTISTGVMLRTAIKEQSEIGKIAEKYINDGKLVPDDEIREVDLFSPKEKEFACKLNPYQTGKLLIQANDSRWS